MLGVANLVASPKYNLLTSFVFSLASSIGFYLYLFICTIRIKLKADVPEAFKGVPIALITAGLLAMIFSRFEC